MAEIINNIKAFKNLRNKTIFGSYNDALTAITATHTGVEDGQIALARYYDGSETMTTKGVKTAIGVYHTGLNVTDGRGAEGWTVYSNDDDIIAKKFADVATDQTTAIKTAIEALDADVTSTGTSELVTVKVVETDGKITEVTVTDTIANKIQALIDDALEGLAYTGGTDGTLVTQVTQEDGLIAVTKADLTSTDKTVTVNGLDLAVNIDNATIVKNSNGEISVASSAITLTGKEAIEVSTATTGNEVSLKIDAADKVLTQGTSGLLANLELKYTPKTDTANGKIELIGKDNTVISTFNTADFTVDGFLDSVAFSTESGKENFLIFTWNTTAGKSATEVDLSKYIDTYTNGDGLNLTDKEFSVKIKTGETYLEVTEEGVASKGIDTAISTAVGAAKTELLDGVAESGNTLGKLDAAINDLATLVGDESVEDQIKDAIDDLTGNLNTSTSADGKYVSDVTKDNTTGKITVTKKALVSEDEDNILQQGEDGGVYLGNVFDCGYWD